MQEKPHKHPCYAHTHISALQHVHYWRLPFTLELSFSSIFSITYNYDKLSSPLDVLL
jgi:hypothetical protein